MEVSANLSVVIRETTRVELLFLLSAALLSHQLLYSLVPTGEKPSFPKETRFGNPTRHSKVKQV